MDIAMRAVRVRKPNPQDAQSRGAETWAGAAHMATRAPRRDGIRDAYSDG